MRTFVQLGSLSLAIILGAGPGASAADKQGNGGDANEMAVLDIATDIRSWILQRGSEGLTMPSGMTVGRYNELMLTYLDPKTTNVSFTDSPILVYGAEKTCKNYFNDKGVANILCNNARFAQTQSADRYKLFHHEFAGLAGLETNSGASSDYTYSSQITEFLGEARIPRLGIKKRVAMIESGYYDLEEYTVTKLLNDNCLTAVTVVSSNTFRVSHVKNPYQSDPRVSCLGWSDSRGEMTWDIFYTCDENGLCRGPSTFDTPWCNQQIIDSKTLAASKDRSCGDFHNKNWSGLKSVKLLDLAKGSPENP